MSNRKVIGYRVLYLITSSFVCTDAAGHNFCSPEEPLPVSRGDAYRRLAAYLDENPWADEKDFSVEPLHHQPTPLEKVSAELGGLLQSLCARHGLYLGLTPEQLEKQIAKELEALKEGGSSFLVTGVPR